MNRVRRQVQPGAFNPFPGGFAFPQPMFNFPNVPAGQGQGSFVSTSQTLSSRFGDDEPVVTGQTQTFHHNAGQYQQVTTNLRPDGSVTTNKQTGESQTFFVVLFCSWNAVLLYFVKQCVIHV